MDFFKEDWCVFDGIEAVDSPALIVYKDRVVNNINLLKSMIGDVDRLRPHVKTHKIKEVTNLLIAAGINKFKCATIAEAEMLGICKAKDVLLAYQPTKVKLNRFLSLIKQYPATAFSCLVDNKTTANVIAAEALANNLVISVYIDLNVGMDRTGIKPNKEAAGLYHYIKSLSGAKVIGFHIYDGHINEKDFTKREEIWAIALAPADMLIQQLKAEGNTVKLVAGGIPTFPFHAKLDDRECSPGTFVFWDAGYGSKYKEQAFLPAAIVLTRVISVVSENLVCIDLGYKAIASENNLNRRVHFLNHPEAKPVSHSEEHMVVQLPAGVELKIGDILYALPIHICPTVSSYEKAYIVEANTLADSWDIIARDRTVSI